MSGGFFFKEGNAWCTNCTMNKSIVFKQFLANFMKPEHFGKLSSQKLKDPKSLVLTESEHLLKLDRMFIGSVAEKEILGYFKSGNPLRKKFLKIVQSAYVKCAIVLQKKLPITNKVIHAMAAFDPCSSHSGDSFSAFEQLPDLVTNVLTVDVDQLGTIDDKSTSASMEVEQESKVTNLKDSYKREVRKFCSSVDHPPAEEDDVETKIDEWWAKIGQSVGQSGKYPILHRMVSSLLTCFHGPAVESSFSSMKDVMDSNSQN